MVRNKKSSFGPGFLVTAAFIGPGTVTSCSLAGARFGYSLIYALVFATITTLFLQEMTGRLSLGSGMDLGQTLRIYSRNKAIRLIIIVLTLSAITFGCAAYEAGNIIGGSLGLETLTPVPQNIWVVFISITAFLILNRQRYKLIEKFLIFLVFLMSLSFITTFIIIGPDYRSLIRGLLPSIPESSGYLILALIGTTVVPYNLFLHSSAVAEKWKKKTDLKFIRKDLLVSICLGGVISIAIVVTAAVAFFGSNVQIQKGIDMASQLKPLFGPLTNVLFGLGFFAAGMSSAITAPYAAAFASSGVLGWKNGKDSSGFKAVWMGVIGIGLTVSLFDLNPISVIIFAQAANGLILPFAAVFLLVILNKPKIMGDMKNNLYQNLLGGLIALVVSLLGIWNIVRLFF
jgi:manganese transport protein